MAQKSHYWMYAKLASLAKATHFSRCPQPTAVWSWTLLYSYHAATPALCSWTQPTVYQSAQRYD